MRSCRLASPLTSSSFPSPNHCFCKSHSSPIKAFSFKAAASSSSSSSCSSSGSPHGNLRIGSPQPPWLVLPPMAAPSSSPFDDGREAPVPPPTLFEFQAQGPSVGIPFSLRLVQLMKKKKMQWRRARLTQTTPTDQLDPIGGAVLSLASVVEELQRQALAVEDEAGGLMDISESIVWLFEKVFCASPNLAVDVLVLVARFLATSTKREIPTMIIKVLESKSENSAPYRLPTCWSDIGVLEESEFVQARRTDFVLPYYRRRRLAYEQTIISGNINSLILSNYAQLLYQYENDLERANDYFNWAVMTEPVDAEAMNKYASFLWLGRGELEKAEEMYLEAIQAEPENSHHQSSYAWFLWRTGGLDTCFALEECDDVWEDEDL